MRTAALLCSLALGLGACGDPKCSAPSQTEYTCQPLPPGTSGGCIGGPTYPGHPQEDPDKNVPLGCHATLPFCSTYATGDECNCGLGATNTPGWGCLL